MRQVRSTTDTSDVGTRKAIPVSFPLRLGITFPTALAAPVADGMMLMAAVRPPRQSFSLGPSTVFCVAVYEWTVVIRPSMMLYFSWITLASGDRQLVVHDALLPITCSTHPVYTCLLQIFTVFCNDGVSLQRLIKPISVSTICVTQKVAGSNLGRFASR